MQQQIQSFTERTKIQDERILELQEKCNEFIKNDILKERKIKALESEYKSVEAQNQLLQADLNLTSNQFQEERRRVSELMDANDRLVNKEKKNKKALMKELNTVETDNRALRKSIKESKQQIKYLEDAIIKKDEKLKKLKQYKSNSVLNKNSSVARNLFANVPEILEQDYFEI